MATGYLAFLDGRAMKVHLVRETAETSLCGLPKASLSDGGRMFRASVCRDCIDWIPRRWTESQPKAERPS